MDSESLVKNLKPLEANTVMKGTTVLDAAFIMTAKKAYCLLVIDSQDGLVGIFTAKDIAFRVVAEGKSALETKVEDIITPDPITVNMQSLSIEALDIMVDKEFRHLPVCNEFGDVVGMLDIISCMYEGIENLTQNSDLFKDSGDDKLNPDFDQIHNYLEDAKKILDSLQVGSILKEESVAKVYQSESILEASKLMKAKKSTCALVIDEQSNAVIGILTTKDIILRVVAANIDPATATVDIAMTPHPDTIVPTTLVMDALIQMHTKKYMNLPVVSNSGQISGVITVSELCRATLSLIDNRHSIPINEEFINEFDEGNQDLQDYQEYEHDYVDYPQQQDFPQIHDDYEYADITQYHDDPNLQEYDMVQSQYDDSRDENESPDNGYSNYYYTNESTDYEHMGPSLAQSQVGSSTMYDLGSQMSSYYQNAQSILNYNSGRVSFKFKSNSGKIYRFSMETTTSYDDFRSTIVSKVIKEIPLNAQQDFSLKIEFLDSDGDYIILTNDKDLDAMITSHINSTYLTGSSTSQAIPLKVSISYKVISETIIDKPTAAKTGNRSSLSVSSPRLQKFKPTRTGSTAFSLGLMAASIGLVAFAIQKYANK
ncbi:CBS domain-containing protein CBSCBSPB3 [Smittium culicis]|uniref:CBS domain-containing protein CBSCBSPB3 n=1 Tax=Smittium culicis TaxID=133412 RepID=A0A1R1XLG3_9FUNG|nr:CBS domain-containing protein CBSCBSPB3 [Smittium culicis]OMJ15462.1 CBS domain-containing protein CBSCBSPB3 [Smittium culicis]OMJ21716.1 CBS domain-containing protein CBSCBSPB3 [Smittium culicis]